MENALRNRLLDLDYSPKVPLPVLAAMERLGRRMGLPLDTLEQLGQDPAVCDAFVRAGRRPGRAGPLWTVPWTRSIEPCAN